MINKKTVESYLRDTAKTNGYTINEQRLPVMIDKFALQMEKHWQMYCPCQPNQTSDTICPCKYMKKHNACRCGLYVKEEKY